MLVDTATHKHDKKAEKTIVEIAAGDERFTTLVGAVKNAGLVETLSSDDGPFTVFAPTNDAFAKLPAGTLDSLTTEQLTGILTYHVLAGKVKAKQALTLDGKSVATVNGAEIKYPSRATALKSTTPPSLLRISWPAMA